MGRTKRGKTKADDLADIFNEEWINEEQALLLAMAILECPIEEAAQALKDFREENPHLVFKEQ